MEMEKIGSYAYLLGFLIAVIVGLLVGLKVGGIPLDIVAIVLVILGLIIGLLNITDKETVPFLVASIALISANAVNWAAISVDLGLILNSIFYYIGVLVAPAALVVALLAIYRISSPE